MVGRFGLYSRRRYEKASQAIHLCMDETTIVAFRKSNEMSLVEV